MTTETRAEALTILDELQETVDRAVRRALARLRQLPPEEVFRLDPDGILLRAQEKAPEEGRLVS